MITIRNPIYNAVGTIDCEIEHPDFGWIPFTASPEDTEQHGRDIYEAALSMYPDVYLEPEAPPPHQAIPQVVSRFQARAALYGAGLLDDVEAAVAASDPLVQMAWADAQEFRRDSPTILSLAAVLGLSETDVDELFVTASGLVA